jgi:hypothetical protein
VADRVAEAFVVLVDGHEEADRQPEIGRLGAELVDDLDDRSLVAGDRRRRVALEVVRLGRRLDLLRRRSA